MAEMNVNGSDNQPTPKAKYFVKQITTIGCDTKQIGDGINDGIFTIKQGEGLSQAISSELGLTAEQSKQLGQSVWTKIFEQIDNSSKNSDSNLPTKDKNGNYNVKEGQIIQLSQNVWSKITTIVNNELKTNIKTDFSKETSVNASSNPTMEMLLSSTDVPPEQINMDDFTVEALRQIYPEGEYIIEDKVDIFGQRSIIVMSNDEEKCYLYVKYNKNNKLFEIKMPDTPDNVNKKWHCGYYDKNGKLISYHGEDGHIHNIEDEKVGKIANSIYNDINEGDGIIFSSTNPKIMNHVYMIDSNNVIDVIEKYKQDYNSDIIRDIMAERNIGIEYRIFLVTHIKDVLIEKCKKAGVYTDDISADFDAELRYQQRKLGLTDGRHLSILLDNLKRRYENRDYANNSDTANGKIDKDFRQGGTGDCWLIATIKSLVMNDKSKKALESLISIDKNGNVTVTLKGVNKKYTFTQEQIKGAQELSSGDMDVRAIEMAVNRYFHEEIAHSNKISIESFTKDDIKDGNKGRRAMQILFGEANANMIQDARDDWSRILGRGNKAIRKIKTGEYMCLVAATHGNPQKAYDQDGNEVMIEEDHAYSLIDADDKYVYLKDPRMEASKGVLRMTHKDFKKTFSYMFIYDLSKLE